MKRILHFWELPEKSRFLLKFEFWKKLYDFKKKSKLSWYEIAEMININSGTLKNYIAQFSMSKKAQFIPQNILKRISTLIKMPISETEKFIIKVRYGEHGKAVQMSFPINFLTPEWAALTGALLAEGYISSDFNVGFWNVDREVLNKFIELSKKLFSEGIRVNYKTHGCFFPAIVGQILIIGLGLETGDKTKKNLGIPYTYLNSNNKKILKSMLSWLFTGDGWVTIHRDKKKHLHRVVGIGFGSPKEGHIPQLIRGVDFALDFLQIRHSKPREQKSIRKSNKLTYYWRIIIAGKNNINKFKDLIDFIDKKKQKRVNKILKSYIRTQLSPNESLDNVIRAVDYLYSSNKDVNKHSVSEITHLNEKWVEALLKKARDMNKITVIGGGKRINGRLGGKSPYIYKPLKMSR
ncbi:MAG: hypothetical protein QXD43_01975 [Candidatus Aenigmatarchaeota archaeon]